MSKPRTGTPRRVAAGILASSLALFGVALAPTAGATTSVSTSRIAGTTRYGTAKAVAQNAAFAGTVAIVATGENFPDALAASALAGANGPAPIVLTQSTVYTQDAKDAIATLKARGLTTIIVVGGTDAISDAVLASIKADVTNTTRTAGTDRYETASAIATAANAKKTVGTTGTPALKTAFIATGTNFPDALAGGPLAYANGLPILLVQPTAVPASTTKSITDLGIKKVVILGGTDAVAASVQTTLETQTGNPATRLAGADRNATATAVADYAVSTLAFPASTVLLATGLNFPDALADGPLAGQLKAPILLTASVPAATSAWLDANSQRVTSIIATGGTDALSDADLAAAQTAAQTTSNDVNFTGAPEVVSATLTGINATTFEAVYRVTFDEEVLATPVLAANFKLWSAYGETTTGGTAQRDSTDTKSILVAFAANTSYTEATTLTVATGAVQDSDGKSNPEGETALVARTFAANSSRMPDLVSVTVVDSTTADFKFDTTVVSLVGTGLHLIDADGTDRASSSAVVQTDATVVRGTFAANSASTPSRGTVDAGTVGASTSATRTNALEAAPVGTASGLTVKPDLLSVSVDIANSRVSFTFDENVATFTGTGAAGNPDRFFVFYRNSANGTVINTSVAATTERSATDARTVVAQFPAGTVNKQVVGAFVTDGAVFREGSVTIGNEQDEKGVATSFTAGEYLGPQLTSVTRASLTDAFGTVTGRRIDYKFDQRVTVAASPAFAVYNSAGDRTVLTGCALAATTVDASQSTVRCNYASDLTSTSSAALPNAVLATAAADSVTSFNNVFVNGTTGAASTLNNHEEKSGIS